MRRSGHIDPTDEALRLNEKLDPIFETLAEIEGAEWATSDDEPSRLSVPPTLAHHFVVYRVRAF